MNWPILLQTMTAASIPLATWFLWDLIREMKTFKESTRSDISTLKSEKITFINVVRTAELTISSKVNDMQRIHGNFSVEVKKALIEINAEIVSLQKVIGSAAKKSENFEAFLDKALAVVKNINDRVRRNEHELQALRIEVSEFSIVKDNKNGK